ncbi:unnamed protein product [Kuraishia capsulata CBS 1993]|uniref:Uncharacterized protein n=1 Tax=Kuraishia capsulata CBS 1993 TaxID=1382522 RepID=W6MRN3_9ASCO|nr:uncharacterized protein KUCA_T00005367001 [Kuraishia capsulata CBS 1993]CDK29379.1 unnamed protein product [Kuraishia capsulata CBS 1993]
MDESSISLEETNRLRAQLGLKPIPVPVPLPVQSSTPATASQAKGELSVDETNKLRISLGLRPLERPEISREDQETMNQREFELKKQQEQKAQQVLERVENTRQRLEQKKRPVSVLDFGEEVDEDDWLNKLGKNVVSKKAVKMPRPKKPVETDDLEGVIIHGDRDGDGDVVMTLKDGSIFDDGDELTNDAFETKKKVEKYLKAKKRGRDLDDDDEDDEDKEFSDRALEKTRNLVHEPIGDLFEDSVEQEKSDYQTFKIKKAKKKKENRRSKTVDVDDELVEQLKEPTRVELQSADVVEDDEELERFLSLERRKRLKKQVVSVEDVKEADNPETMDTSESFVVDETLDFLSGFRPVVKAEAKDLGNKEISKPEVSNGADVPETANSPDVTTPTSSILNKLKKSETEAFGSGGIGSALKFLEQRSEISTTASHNRRSREQRDAEMELVKLQPVEAAGTEGLTRKEREKLAEEQREQFLKANAKIQEKRMANYNPEIKIVYRDDKGRELDTKAAYKFAAQKFHGKAPGKNKVDRRNRAADN